MLETIADRNVIEVNENKPDDNCLKHKSKLYRYFVLLNICLIGISSSSCFDISGALQDAVMEKFQISFAQFSLLYSIYGWPNIIITFFGGFLIDRVLGLKNATIVYGAMFVAGYLIFALSGFFAGYWCALLGRFFAGIGIECLYLCLQVHTVNHFKGKELSLAMGLMMSCTGVGISIVYSIAEPLLKYVRYIAPERYDVGFTLLIVGCFSILTFTSGTIIAFSDPSQCEYSSLDKRNQNTVKLTWRDYVIFPKEFWLILGIQIPFNIVIHAFLPFVQDFFVTQFSMSVDSANSVASFYSITVAIAAPFVGIILDKLGRSLMFSKLAIILAIVAHSLLGFSKLSPYIGMFLLSIGFAVYNGSICPMIAYIIPEYKLGTASGVQFSLTSASFALVTYLAGLIVDGYSYRGLEILMLSFTFVGLLSSVLLWLTNASGSGVLNMSPLHRTIYLERLSVIQKD